MKETLKIFRDKLNNNEFVYGPFMKTRTYVYGRVSLAGFDYVILIWKHDLLQLKISKTIFVRLMRRKYRFYNKIKDRGRKQSHR